MTLLPLLLLGCDGTVRDIVDALDRACRFDRPPPPPVEDGELHKITIDEPRAVCNDGTPAVAWVRRATDPEHADDWVIFLAAGGLCSSEGECTARWCMAPGLMSSAESRDFAAANGVLSSDDKNPFRGWNHVSVMYCTSDLWSGRNAKAVLEGDYTYSLSFQGHHVIEGVLETLDRGATSDDGEQDLAKLIEAQRLLWIGSSAGSHGAATHLDWVADRYPGTQVIGAFDSLLFPAPGTYPASLDQAYEDAIAEQYRGRYQDVYEAFLEPSCVDQGLGADCAQMFLVERDHIQTPYVVRHDLFDATLSDALTDAFGASEAQTAVASFESAHQLAEARPDVSLIVPACGNHILATSDAEFWQEKVLDDDGEAWSLQSTLEAAFAGTRVVAIDSVEGDRSVCVSQ